MKFITVAFKNLMRRKVRSGLTLLAISIGIAMLFSFLSFKQGYQSGLQQELGNMGAHMLAIAKGCPYEATAMIMHGGVIEDYLTTADLATIRTFPNVGNAVGMFMNQLITPHGTTVIQGLDEEILKLKPWWVIQGEGLVDERSVMLPVEMAAEKGYALGDTWTLHELGLDFTVTGLLERTGSQDDQFVYMRIETAQSIFNAEGKLTSVAIQLEDVSLIQAAVKDVESLPDVQAITMNQVLGTVQTLMDSANAMITSIVIIAIIISAIGVMNSFLMSVFERTREIGMMKAVGASRGDVFTLVWIESILLALFGGILGIALATIAGRLIEGALRGMLPFAPTQALLAFDMNTAIASLVAAVVLGTVAGAYPALRASGLSPMEAIRSE